MTEHDNHSNSHELPIESNDDAVLRMLGGATFSPGAKLILPSGKKLNGDEAQAFVSAFDGEDRATQEDKESTIEDDQAVVEMLRGAQFGPNAKVILPSGSIMDAEEANRATFKPPDISQGDNPLDSKFDDWSGNPEIDRARFDSRAMMAVYGESVANPEKTPESTQKSVQNQTRKKRWWRRNR